MNTTIPYLGEMFSLSVAIVWAFAVILFKKSGETVHPLALNFFKNTLGMLLFVPTILISGEILFRPAPLNDYLILLASGVIGIGIADTMFLRSLNLLGAGLMSIVDCMYSPFVIGMSMLWLGESLTIWQTFGVLLVVLAVLTATRKNDQTISRHVLMWGIVWGLSGLAFMALGIVIAKPVLNRSPLMWVTEIRLIGGAVVMGLVLLFHPGRREIISTIWSDRRTFRYTLSGSFVGAYLAMMLWMAGMKYTQVSISSALNQTSNIFLFLFAVLLLKEKSDPLRIAGIVIAVAGAFLVTFG
ncbi:MAG: DMT family transporter [Candidatus Electryoneaceae bacterium]|nr:DMT family transporter [Candidatus Electryoneaceae bacterium]